MSKEGEIEWVHCNQCLRSTQHDVLKVRQISETQYIEGIQDDIDWNTISVVLECRGCGAVCLRQSVFSGDTGIDETEYFPPPIARQRPEWRFQLENDMRELLDECYAALQAGSNRLALMGARALLDLYMTDRVGDVGGFQQKLDLLVQAGHLSARDRNTLEAALETGHAAAHRAYKPKADDVTLVFDIAENLLHPLAIEKKVSGLRSRIPKRKMKKQDAGR
jgi:Domain of unknown function (DUF4145)